MTGSAYTPAYRGTGIPCVVCRGPLALRIAHGRKSGKPFLMLVCTEDGRHFRAFINDQRFVRGVLNSFEIDGGKGLDDALGPGVSSKHG